MMEEEPELWRAGLVAPPVSASEQGAAGAVGLALPSDLVHAAAQAAGVFTAEVLLPMFSRSFEEGDVFARQEAAEALSSNAAARAPGDGTLIVTTTLTLRDYDLAAGGWR